MAAIKYKISFVPESKFGCITKVTTNRKEAYSIYRKLKAEVGEIRVGWLSITEFLDDGTERYLCRYETGKDRNGKLIVQNIKKEVKKLSKVYNQEYLNNKTLSYDAILACYHDQGLCPIKALAFDNAINTTIGLDIIRTSPSSGTAYDIAGKNIANPNSMIKAIELALKLSI